MSTACCHMTDRLDLARRVIDDMILIGRTIKVYVGYTYVTLDWQSPSNARLQHNATAREYDNQGALQWMVSLDGEDVSLCTTLADAVENAYGELVHRVLVKEYRA